MMAYVPTTPSMMSPSSGIDKQRFLPNEDYVFADDVARSRYQNAFTSNIFNPSSKVEFDNLRHVPPGKRRDRETSELFGTDLSTVDLRAQPGTFYPREDDRSARQKKIEFLESDVLPHGPRLDAERLAHASSRCGAPPLSSGRANVQIGGHGGGHGCAIETYDEDAAFEKQKASAEAAPVRRRQLEMQSNLFNRHTPDTENDAGEKDASGHHFAQCKLTPTDFNWYTAPREIQEPRWDNYDSQKRAYEEQTSKLFEYKGPERASDGELEERAKEERRYYEKERALRQGNVYYSDLFERETPGMVEKLEERVGEGGAGGGVRYGGSNGEEWHPRHPTSGENCITINQEWSDAKTEMYKDGEDKCATGRSLAQCRAQEFDRTRVYNLEHNNHRHPSPHYHPDTQRGEQPLVPLITDNSKKTVRAAENERSGQIHQKHLKSSMMENDFYSTAESKKSWEVAEVHLSGLTPQADEKYIRDLLRGTGGHLVKVNVESDPVSHLCKGRAKIVLRYNPEFYEIREMIQILEGHGLLVLE